MRAQNENLFELLVSSRRIDIAVIGRKSGRRITLPVWLVVEKNVLYLLPVDGTDTEWFKNLLHNPAIYVSLPRSGGSKKSASRSPSRRWFEFRARPTTAPKQVVSVIRKFGDKYKASVVKKLYSKFDAAVRVPLR